MSAKRPKSLERRKQLFLELFLTLEMPIAVIIGSLLQAYCEITNLKKEYI